ncbi:MAG: hypothetical protein AAB851_00460, partial [Patescibacteria group bacterium]
GLLAIVYFLAVILHFGLASVFAYTINKINLVVLFVIIVLLITESGRTVWIGFTAYFFMELFSLAPFGAALYSGTISALISFWLYKTVFANRTILTTVALTAIFILIYRSQYSAIIYAVCRFSGDIETTFFSQFASYGWELAITAVAAGLAHFFLKLFIPKLNTTKLRK